MIEPERPTLTPAQRRKVVRAAALRPLNAMTLIAGLGISATTGLWWILALTVVVYATVVYLAARDPVFTRRVIEGGSASRQTPHPSRDVSPERRARWLPRGETREKVESALVTYRKVVLALEESDDVTKRVLEGAIPRLHDAAERLVDLAESRQRAATTLEDFEGRSSSERELSLRGLENHVRKADAEISGISEQFLTLRAQVVRASVDTTGATQQAAVLNESLDELNFRLEALNETLSTPEDATKDDGTGR